MAVSVTAPLAGSAGTAYLPAMSPSYQWQVCWQSVTLPIYGQVGTWYQGEVIPGTPVQAEKDELNVLAANGAVRRVNATATAADFGAAVSAAATAETTRIKAGLAAAGVTLPASANPRGTVIIGGVAHAGP